MRVLIACESSGTERRAFLERGHDVWSCDLLPADDCDSEGRHIVGDVTPLLAERWDLVIAHPPCTYLANSGARWLYQPGTRELEPQRWHDMAEGAAFFALMFTANTPRLCVENPVQHGHAVRAHGQGKPAQTVQPYQFGHLETKRTAYWLRGLPPLQPTDDRTAEALALPYAQRAKVHHASPGPDRWKLRSVSYPGIAAAMAYQWGT